MTGAFALLDDLVAGGKTLVHPFDDPMVLAAHGTVGLEFATDAPDLTDVLVSIGGGALISGVATAFRALRPGVRVWGWRPRAPTRCRRRCPRGLRCRCGCPRSPAR
jgi:threonine dehydratase